MSSPVLISSLPKSGTWYHQNFFYYLQYFYAADKNADESVPEDQLLIRRKTPNYFDLSRCFDGVDEVCIGHAFCPGYEKSDDPKKEDWKKLKDWSEGKGYDWMTGYISNAHKEGTMKNGINDFDPAKNPDVKIVYLYRNPLSHFVSHYNHLIVLPENRMENKIMYPHSGETPIPMEDFIFHYSLETFIKHFYSFKAMAATYPENVMMVSYDSIIEDPESYFTKLLDFIGIKVKPKPCFLKRLFHKNNEKTS